MSAYQTMWANLGIDCAQQETLQRANALRFSELYAAQADRPASMAYYDKLALNAASIRPAELWAAHGAGTKIFGMLDTLMPEEIVLAAGGIAVNLSTLLPLWLKAGSALMPRCSCPLMRSTVGSYADKTYPYPRLVDLVAGIASCDSRRRALEVLGDAVDTYPVSYISSDHPWAAERWRAELDEFMAVVEEMTGRTVTAEALHQAVRVLNARRDALTRVHRARQADPVPISGLDALLVNQIALNDDPVRAAFMANELADELESRIKQGRAACPAGAKRILVCGMAQAPIDARLYAAIEACGAVVVAEEGGMGSCYCTHPVREVPDDLDGQLNAIVQRILEIDCVCFSASDRRFAAIERLSRSYRADGVINACLGNCVLYDPDDARLQRALAPAGIPCLSVVVDHNEDESLLYRRVAQFVEGLNK